MGRIGRLQINRQKTQKRESHQFAKPQLDTYGRLPLLPRYRGVRDRPAGRDPPWFYRSCDAMLGGIHLRRVCQGGRHERRATQEANPQTRRPHRPRTAALPPEGVRSPGPIQRRAQGGDRRGGRGAGQDQGGHARGPRPHEWRVGVRARH